jgi:hypothetical protein
MTELNRSVNVARTLNYASYLTVLVSYSLTGIVASALPEHLKRVFDQGMPGKPLPEITHLILDCASYPTTFIVELAVGFLFLGLLLFLEHGDAQRRAYLPSCIAVSLLLCWFQLLIVLLALTMPLIPLVA